MSEILDQKIRSTVVELMESSPPPHPAHQALKSPARGTTPLSLRSGLARMAAVAAVVLLVGLGAAWLTGYLAAPDVVAVTAVDGVASPEPEFDPSQFGREVGLQPPTGRLQPEVPSGTLDGDAVAVGQIAGTDLEVFKWDTVDGETCVQVVGPQFRDTQCSTELPQGPDPSDPLDGPEPFVTTRIFGDDTGEVISVWRVPDDTSIVLGRIGSADGVWQRPVSGVSAFAVAPDSSSVTLDAVDSEQRTLAVAFFSPIQTVDPVQRGETDLQGSPQDLVALEASNPVNQILFEGATDMDSFADAAEERGLQFVCGGGGGGTPSHMLCLVGLDGTLIVVPFGDEPGLTVRISDPDLAEDVVVPLDRTEPVGVTNVTGGGVPVQVEYFGDEIGSLSRPPIFSGGS